MNVDDFTQILYTQLEFIVFLQEKSTLFREMLTRFAWFMGHNHLIPRVGVGV